MGWKGYAGFLLFVVSHLVSHNCIEAPKARLSLAQITALEARRTSALFSCPPAQLDL